MRRQVPVRDIVGRTARFAPISMRS